MACYSPIKGYRSRTVNESGKRGIVFNARLGFTDLPQDIPCGQCIGCRLERSRQWAMRCLHETTLHPKSCFITLTYNNENLPANGTLVKRHFQLFMKKLRKLNEQKIRYFHCGEYGEKFQRPHYHACIFNYYPKDTALLKEDGGIKLYTSQTLQEIWGLGFVTVGEVNFETAAYVARYCTKKITGEKAEAHYNGRLPEYTTMSRRPGIGKEWFDKYQTDIFPSDFIIVRNQKLKPPKYYDKLYEHSNPLEFADIKSQRIATGKENALDNTPERLQVKETIQVQKFKQLKRSYEND